MEHYDQDYFEFDEKAVQDEGVYMMEEEEDPAALLLSDQLMEDDDESEIYEMADETLLEDDDDEIIVGTPQPQDMEGSFYIEEEEEEEGLVQENPFEPVYPATAALLGSDENVDISSSEQASGKGIVLEAISLDNILPAGSRRRRN